MANKPGMNLTGWTLAFDLDGTLVETAPDLIGVLNVLLEERGLPTVPMSSARRLISGGVKALLTHGFEEAGATFDPDAETALMDRFIDLYLARIADESRPYPGVVETLEAFAKAGARLVVVTNKRTDLSVALLDALDLSRRFASIVGPDVVSARKPSGAHLKEAVERVGGDPACCIMVGDSYPDLATARALGAPIILTTFGYSETPVADLDADAVVDRFSDILEIVDALLFSPPRENKAPRTGA